MGASGVLRLDGSTLTADLTAVQRAAQAVEDAVPVTALLDGHPQLARRFRRGRLVRVPERWAEQAELAGVLVGLLPAGTELAEVEVNRVLGEVGEPATLRRLLVDHGALERDPAALVYRRREG
ncbi:DUF2087 domain-containing protein [Auraticoccus sp. F435]|uniref:DUF2087 domain-containing protein n=2 Tax=Auraticoccus cholistanensis TaxID=2656650 RepID=A0A6A9UZB6_9ACTN|nr:DUF2087 domain-containing protein [Auraticoccus cholistanensis]MVA77314.1 DUF2087 domain-containing protein [Auraticoccus cholistanensis]